MTDTPTPRDWPEGLPAPDTWLRFDADGQADARHWTADPGAGLIEAGFTFTRALSEEERAAVEAYLLQTYRPPEMP